MILRSALFLSVLIAALQATAHGADSAPPVPENSPAPVGSPQWVSRLVIDDDDPALIQEAPPHLLARYLRARGLGKDPKMWARDQAALAELLWYYDVNGYQATEGNEILRPRAIKALRQMMDAMPDQPRLMLRMPIQLMDYDIERGVFRIHYPQFFSGDQPAMAVAFPMRNPLRGVCVHLPGSDPAVGGPNFLRPDSGPGYFRVQPICRQANHPTIPWVTSAYPVGELPGSVVLRFPPGSLWSEFPLDEERAAAFVTTPTHPGRIAMAILVFDVVGFHLGTLGPFNVMHPYDTSQRASIFDIEPQALFVWRHKANYPPVFFGAVGNVGPVPADQDMRLTHALVTAPTAKAAGTAAPATSAPASPRKDAKPAVAVPPPARRSSGAGQPAGRPADVPPVPVGR